MLRAWLDYLQGKGARAGEMPIFPLNTVFFPGGVLSLKVLEPRYKEMVARCLERQSPFGICLAESGHAGDGGAMPHPVGTCAEIVGADQSQPDMLVLSLRGSERFRIETTRTGKDGILYAKVTLLAKAPTMPPPAERKRLLPLLLRIINDLGPEKMPEPYAFDDSDWVGYRLIEVMPVQNLAKQKMLELENPLVRLEILEKYLDQRKLLD